MEDDFYRKRLQQCSGIEVVIPREDQREYIHRIIYEELCHGRVEVPAREKFVEIIEDLSRRGAQGAVLACTEIPLLVRTKDVELPLFDTTRLHAEAAVEWALKEHQTRLS